MGVINLVCLALLIFDLQVLSGVGAYGEVSEIGIQLLGPKELNVYDDSIPTPVLVLEDRERELFIVHHEAPLKEPRPMVLCIRAPENSDDVNAVGDELGAKAHLSHGHQVPPVGLKVEVDGPVSLRHVEVEVVDFSLVSVNVIPVGGVVAVELEVGDGQIVEAALEHVLLHEKDAVGRVEGVGVGGLVDQLLGPASSVEGAPLPEVAGVPQGVLDLRHCEDPRLIGLRCRLGHVELP
mmetsp:Transcript_18430/g.31517  ORF Transcript_18430/g.31517 Transcript_18430/m.31517 type:complete len:237 (-) Transcript_18430:1105-1815(-)